MVDADGNHDGNHAELMGMDCDGHGIVGSKMAESRHRTSLWSFNFSHLLIENGHRNSGFSHEIHGQFP